LESYNEWAPSTVETVNSDGPATDGINTEQMSFRLEIVLVPGREGAKLQAIQARAIREALLWAAQREDDRNNPGEDGNDGHDE
jgi:hypothetical protein